MKVKKLIEMLLDVHPDTDCCIQLRSDDGYKLLSIQLVGSNEDITLLASPFDEEDWIEWDSEWEDEE